LKVGLVVVVAALSTVLLHAQATSDDPRGWSKAKWGMTKKQIQTTFPETTLLENDEYGVHTSFLGIRGYLISSEQFTVTFSFSKDGRLEYVLLEPENRYVGKDGKEFSGPPTAVAEDTKMTLLKLLTDKYGKPTQLSTEPNERGGGLDRKWQWVFPQTIIELEWVAFGDPEFKHLDKTDLSYSLRTRRKDL
jgi:hypothetical protein